MVAEPLDRLLSELHSLRVTLEGLRVTLAALSNVVADHEARVRVLERSQQRLTPVLSGLTFLLGALATELLGRVL